MTTAAPDPQRELMGVGEAAAHMGVSKQRIHQLARTFGFPEPAARLDCGPIWYGRDIRAFARIRKDLARLTITRRGAESA